MRILANTTESFVRPKGRRTMTILVCAIFCAVGSASGIARGQGRPPSELPAAARQAQALPLPPVGDTRETSWLIVPDVPRIPRVRGLEPDLPAHIERRLGYAFDLAQRGATYTADAEFRAVLGLCALELDGREGGTTHREALRSGWIAIDEAEHFSGNQAPWRAPADVRNKALGHMTPGVRSAKRPIDSIEAMQIYYAYAEARLADAFMDLPGASIALYGLARTYEVRGTTASLAASKAVLLHRSALAVAPQNVLSANELGVLLAQHGQLDDAQAIFQRCLTIEETPQTWKNLAVVYARKGNLTASQAARVAGEELESKKLLAAQATTESAHPGSARTTAVNQDRTGRMPQWHLIPKLSNPFRR
jgi:tetratricopeptide (TPR) repeat protein